MRPRSASALAAFVAAAIAACGGSGRPAELGDQGGGPRDAGAGQTPSLTDDASTLPPLCVMGVDAGPCDCVDESILTDVPNVYFVLDRSGSMNDSDKWSTVRAVLALVAQKLGPRIDVGAAVFPDPEQNGCTAGREVMPMSPGDPPTGFGRIGPTTALLAATLNVGASGGTPTAATLQALAPHLTQLASQARTYVILATDGGPNCNPSATCAIDQCIPNIESASGCAPSTPPNCCTGTPEAPENCIDAEPTSQAVRALADAGIPVYVVGVPGSGPYAALLDQLATAGRTARDQEPRYFRVDSADQAAFESTLAQIAAKITATCTLPLKGAPPDPTKVNVFLDEQVVPEDPVNGWSLDGATVTLLGDTCQKVLSGQALDVRVIAGCPTVVK